MMGRKCSFMRNFSDRLYPCRICYVMEFDKERTGILFHSSIHHRVFWQSLS